MGFQRKKSRGICLAAAAFLALTLSGCGRAGERTQGAIQMIGELDYQGALEQLDAAGNLRFILGRDYDSVQAAAMLAELGLGDVNGKPVRAFSGGMRRRLALARALLARSDALALDEPFAGLDGETRQRAWNCILHRRGRRPVLLVTHDEADAAGLGAQIVRLV